MKRTDWKSGLLWVACFALSVVVMGWVTRQESDHQLEQQAEQSGLRWARQLAGSVPELAQTFALGQATPAVLAHMGRLQLEATATEWSLLDVNGRVVLDSRLVQQSRAGSSQQLAGTPVPAADGVDQVQLRKLVLTGTLNRNSFHALLVRTTNKVPRSGQAFSILRVNLDRFKHINDSLSRERGDEILRLSAQRMRACLQPGDQIGRLEGDEFAVLLLGPASRDAVEPVARKISLALAEPFALAGQEVRCGASTGIAMFGVHGTDPDDLLAKTDLALIRCKTQNRGAHAFFDTHLDRQMQSRRDLARDLHAAVAQRQLTTNYQPLFATDAQELLGYEALLRWKHPVRGMVSPAEFVPLAEAAGLIDDIGLWVLRQACADASEWPASLTVAVNLSANQFASGALVRQVSRALADSGLAPERLVLEITESLLMNNSEQVMQTLRSLGALGVAIAMDDFGTGYSSLAYLWRFPFDKVKVDQVFTRNMVKDPKVAMIVRSIITLAHSLDMRVNAEGIESPEQMAALQALGCDELQGFLLGRPAPQSSLSHDGHRQGGQPVRPRGDDRESLFATLHMDLPLGPDSN